MVTTDERYELETMTISALLQDREAYQDIIMVLRESDFENHSYRQIFKNLRNGLGIGELRSGTELRPSEFARLIIVNKIPSTVYGYAEQLREIVTKQRLETELAQIAKSKNLKADIPETIERISRLFEYSRLNLSDGADSLGTLMEKAVREIIKITDMREKIIYSPYANLNSLIGGLIPGNLITIAGRPGTGKTAFALQIALSVARRKFKTLYISLEMLGTQLAMRVFSTDTGVSTIAMANGKATGEELFAITKSVDLRKSDNLLITKDGKNTSEIRSKVSSIKPELLVIDSLNLMEGKGETERIRMTRITREIKQMALQFGVPIMMLAQLNRESEGQMMPTLLALKESGSIEEDSDVVILLSEIKDENTFDKINDAFKQSEGDYMLDPLEGFKDAQRKRNKIIVGNVAKNRNGPTGKVAYLCTAKRYAFEELPKGVTYLE